MLLRPVAFLLVLLFPWAPFANLISGSFWAHKVSFWVTLVNDFILLKVIVRLFVRIIILLIVVPKLLLVIWPFVWFFLFHDLHLRKQAFRLLREAFFLSWVIVYSRIWCCICYFHQELLFLPDELLLAPKIEARVIRQFAVFLLAYGYLEDFVIFTKRKKLHLFGEKVIQVYYKLCDGIHCIAHFA